MRMATTSIHLPKELLAAVDREAARRGISRNRLITDAVWLAVRDKEHWRPGLFAELHDSALGDRDR